MSKYCWGGNLNFHNKISLRVWAKKEGMAHRACVSCHVTALRGGSRTASCHLSFRWHESASTDRPHYALTQKPHRSDSQSAGTAETPEQLSHDLINVGQVVGSRCSGGEATVTPAAPECAPDISSCHIVNLTGITQELDNQPRAATHNNGGFCRRPRRCIFSSSLCVLGGFIHDEPQIKKNDQTERFFFF